MRYGHSPSTRGHEHTHVGHTDAAPYIPYSLPARLAATYGWRSQTARKLLAGISSRPTRRRAGAPKPSSAATSRMPQLGSRARSDASNLPSHM